MNRFIEKMRDPAQRKLFCAILGGKFLGVLVAFLIIYAASLMIGGGAMKSLAQDKPAATAPAAPAPAPAAPAAAAPAAPADPAAPAAAPAPVVPAPVPADSCYINPINTMWVLVTAFLVFFMQAGFMFLEAGFARSRESVNVMLEGLVDTEIGRAHV